MKSQLGDNKVKTDQSSTGKRFKEKEQPIKVTVEPDSQLQIDDEFRLMVKISKDAISTSNSIEGMLQVHLSASSFDIRDKRQQSIQLPMSKDEELKFLLVPKEAGNHNIEILCYFKGRRIAYTVVQTMVV